ncbi:MAG TPA: exodeoxyribonuclease VII large subunit [Candidatus Saccharibacteria bacterium]|nr:exodeoxyribonuclease VII large subunit [Candidatus Saccharibacteria bacterium]
MSVDSRLEFGVSDFVAVFNQTINYAYSSVVVLGEVSNLRISRNTWLYFSLKDENSSVNFFGSILKLPAPIEDGMMLRVRATPQLHPRFGFSLQVEQIELSGKGTINRANKLLHAKLEKEGLFAPERKRQIPTIPYSIGLITSSESAAYSDFIKIVNQRWAGLKIVHHEALVQGVDSPNQIIKAINNLNTGLPYLDLLVITRGGGSSDDLDAFNDEKLTRAIASSRIPTLVAVGHERDLSFAELVADKRASTPSNAAEIIVPDRRDEVRRLNRDLDSLATTVKSILSGASNSLDQNILNISNYLKDFLNQEASKIELKEQLLRSFDPQAVLNRGYSIVSKNGQTIKSIQQLDIGDKIDIRLAKGSAMAEIGKLKVE